MTARPINTAQMVSLMNKQNVLFLVRSLWMSTVSLKSRYFYLLIFACKYWNISGRNKFSWLPQKNIIYSFNHFLEKKSTIIFFQQRKKGKANKRLNIFKINSGWSKNRLTFSACLLEFVFSFFFIDERAFHSVP